MLPTCCTVCYPPVLLRLNDVIILLLFHPTRQQPPPARNQPLPARNQPLPARNQPPPARNQPPPARNQTPDVHTLLSFPPMQYSEGIDDPFFDNAHLFPCTQPNGSLPGQIEDLMCIPRPSYLPGYKNPCFHDQKLQLYCMPYYNILGFDKCGTTDLSMRLLLHPSVLKCHGYLYKEVYYWGWRRYGLFMKKELPIMSLEGYAFVFSNASEVISPLAGQANQPIVGDGGPVDAWDFRGWPLDPQNRGLSEPKVLAPQNMRHILKEPRFIILMRDPVERLYSDYFFLKYGDSPERFARHARTAVEMMNECLKVNTTRQCFFSGDLYMKTPTRLHIGCYSVFLREWLSVFHRKHFFFLRSEDYNKDIKGSLRAVFAFLGIDTLPDSLMDDIVDRDRYLQNEKKNLAGRMFADTRKMLQDFYEPCNRDLAELLGSEKYLWRDT
ncbi:hypothetical protein BsWGS_28532 [Bradybaena similaris]